MKTLVVWTIPLLTAVAGWLLLEATKMLFGLVPALALAVVISATCAVLLVWRPE